MSQVSVCKKCKRVIVRTEVVQLPVACRSRCGYVDTTGESVTEDDGTQPKILPKIRKVYPKAVVVLEGPGTELHLIYESIGIHVLEDCPCIWKMYRMNEWGVAGCRHNRETIIGWMREDQDKFGWLEKIKAAAMSLVTGLAFELDPLDPFPGLVDEAISRAEEKEEKQKPLNGALTYSPEYLEERKQANGLMIQDKK